MPIFRRFRLNSVMRGFAGRGAPGSPHVGDIDRLVVECEAAALAVNTRKTYETAWNSWRRWATTHRATVFPAEPTT